MNARTIAVIAVGLLSACQQNFGGLGSGGNDSGVVTATSSTGADSGPGPATQGVDATSSSGSDGPSVDTTVGTTGPGGEETGTSEGGSSDTGDEPLPPPSPFGEPVAVPFVNDGFAADDDPTLRPDQLEMYFASTRYGSEDIFVTTRTSTDFGFSIPQPVWELNSGSTETTPELSTDGLLLVFASNRRGNGLEPYYSTRANTQMSWAPPVLMTAVGSSSSETAITPQADGVTLLFCSDRGPTLGGFDIWRGTIDGAASNVIDLQPIVELSSAAIDCPGNSTGDMVWQSFASAGPGAVGGEDLWLAQRQAGGDAFWPSYALTELNSASNEADPWVSPDLLTIYFASDRGGTFDLYMAQREP